MTTRRTLARLGPSLVLVLAVAATGLNAGAPAGASTPVGFDCATIPTQPVAAGVSVSVSARLDGSSVDYRATQASPTTVPTPSYGLPYPGTLVVEAPAGSQALARPADFAGSAVVQLCLVRDRSGAPAVLLGGYTGGAHCCFISAVYVDGPGGYEVAADANVQTITPGLAYDLNQGMAPRDVGGSTLLETADGYFAYRFGCYACTPTPVHLLAIEGARLVDVTSHHRSFVEAHAASLWSAVVQNETRASQYAGLFGALAAWTAEECEIGQGVAAWTQVSALAQRGLLSDAHYHAAAFTSTGSYVPTLESFLLAHGYCRHQIPSG